MKKSKLKTLILEAVLAIMNGEKPQSKSVSKKKKN